MNRVIGRTVLASAALATSLGLAACTRQISPDVVEGPTVGQVVRTELGYIQNARLVQVQESDRLQGNTTGLVLGGATGGLLGNQIGSGWGRILATGAGAVAGATLGAIAEKELTNQPAMEYVFRSDTGQLYTIVQGPQPRLVPGQRAYLQEGGGGRARVVPVG
jgi:outer membrane lipoprotein SlyB